MTVSYGEVRAWKPEPLHTASSELKKCCEQFRRLADELRGSAVPDGWEGRGAAAATRKCRQIADAWEDKAAVAAALDRRLHETALAVEGLDHAIEVVEELAHRYNYVIHDNGAVASTLPGGLMPPDEAIEARERTEAELHDRIEQIIRRAEDVDTDLCATLDRVSGGELDSNQATSIASAIDIGTAQGTMPITPPPPQGAAPTDNAGWWATLSPAERRTMLHAHPELLGNRNGVPAHIRDAANRARIPMERARLQEALRRAEDDDRRAEIQAKLDSLDTIERILDKPDRHVLTLDMSHQRAEAAIANGDVDNADHVAVFTPGFTSTVDGSMAGYDDSMRDVTLRTQRMLEKTDPGATVATVTWLGYQAPQMDMGGVLFKDQSVLFTDAAARGAKDLSGFLNGIDASRPDDPHLTAMGHSYGSLTTGIALQAETGVDDAVVFGSPGLGVDNVGKLDVPDGHLLALEADEDPVADIGRTGHLGADPSTMEGVRHGQTGATPMGGAGVSGHSDYLTENTTSLYNMAAVVSGENQLVIEGNNVDIGDLTGALTNPVTEPAADALEWTWEHMPWNWL